MGRPLRTTLGGYVYHVRCKGLQPKGIFRSDADYIDFLQVLMEASPRFDARLIGFCCLPNGWHMLVIPRRDGDLSKLIAWITITHSARWHLKPRRAASGGLYERRFKSFPVQDDQSVLDMLRFLESHVVPHTEDHPWRWCSAALRANADPELQQFTFLSMPPVPIPNDWSRQLRKQMEPELLAAIENCLKRGCPFGKPDWVERIAARMHLESTLRARGRPRLAGD
jgi:putative transposase